MKLSICIFGMGYVGCANGLLLAKKNKVTMLDIDHLKVENFNAGILPISDKEGEAFFAKESLDIQAFESLDMVEGEVDFFILAREFWVGALRDLNARNGNEAATNVTFLAKIKTTIQLGTFCWILTGLYLNSALMIFLGNFFLILVLIITIQTGLSYTIATFKK